MNKLIYNFKGFCEPSKGGNRTVDGKTFDCLLDHGWSLFQHRRFQLQGVELPDTNIDERNIPESEVDAAGSMESAKRERRRKFARARDCLTLALLGADALVSEPLSPDFRGRSVIVSPFKPNSYLRSVVRVYLQTARNNVLHQLMSVQIAGFSFMDVNKFMFHMGNLGYDVEHAEQILTDFEVVDVTVGRG